MGSWAGGRAGSVLISTLGSRVPKAYPMARSAVKRRGSGDRRGSRQFGVYTRAVEAPRRIEVDYRVRFDEAGPGGLLRSSGYLRYAQDIAWQHSDLHGFDRAWYRQRGLLWLVRCVQLDVVGGIRSGEMASVSTQVVGARRVWARRRGDVRLGSRDGELAATVITDWVLMHEDGRAARVPAEIAERFSDGTSFEPARVTLGEPGPGAWTVELMVRPQDLDPMAHVNNATYVDYVEEVLAAGGRVQAGSLRRFQLEYLRPAGPAERLTATCWAEDLVWAVSIVGAAGDAVIRARASQ